MSAIEDVRVCPETIASSVIAMIRWKVAKQEPASSAVREVQGA